MSTEKPTQPQFMLMMRGSHAAFSAMSPDEKQRIMEKYYAFVDKLRSENRFKGGSALSNKSAMLKSGNDGKVVIVDGPFAESKEALNGYFIFEAANHGEAVELAKDCPALLHGETVEVIELSSH